MYVVKRQLVIRTKQNLSRDHQTVMNAQGIQTCHTILVCMFLRKEINL